MPIDLPHAAQEILDYWAGIGPQGWYAGGDALDAEIRDRFEDTWNRAAQGGLRDWLCTAPGMLAYLILTDQMPRNMFRGTAKAFATDAKARAVAIRASMQNHDLAIDEPIRQFFYLPLMHSENRADQDRCVSLMKARMPVTGAPNLLHARAHREVIRRFGRFPYRNAALGRETSAAERAFLDQGGYGAIVRALGG
ncbi:MAG: DUF924 family protein [Pararhodobacter sp.]